MHIDYFLYIIIIVYTFLFIFVIYNIMVFSFFDDLHTIQSSAVSQLGPHETFFFDSTVEPVVPTTTDTVDHTQFLELSSSPSLELLSDTVKGIVPTGKGNIRTSFEESVHLDSSGKPQLLNDDSRSTTQAVIAGAVFGGTLVCAGVLIGSYIQLSNRAPEEDPVEDRKSVRSAPSILEKSGTELSKK